MSLQCMANAADVGQALQRRCLLDHPAGREAGCKKSSCMGMSHALWSGESQGSEGHGETRDPEREQSIEGKERRLI